MRKTFTGHLLVVTAAAFALSCSNDGPEPLDPDLLPPSRIDVAYLNSPTGTATTCMEDVVETVDGSTAVPLNCTANDLNLFFTIPGQGQDLPLCLPGDDLPDLEVEAHFGSGAANRWDIGLWIRADDQEQPDALRGLCRHWSLVPVGTEGDLTAPGGVRTAPFYNEDGDSCGDLNQNFETVLSGVILQNLTCRDSNGDGFLDVGACVGYDNNGNQDHSCTDPEDAVLETRPNTKAKCSCGPLDIPVRIAGKITIEKQTLPDGSTTSFNFDGSVDDLDDSLTDGESYFALLEAGSYTVQELVPAGWDLTSIQCTDTGESTTSVNLGTATASIELESGEEVTCVFTNRQRGSIEIEKQTVPDGETESFSFTDNIAAPNAFNLQDDGVKTFLDVVPGAYSVTEGTEDDFNLTDIQCDDANSTGNTGTRTAAINVEPGETVRCVFTNTVKAGTIIIEKETDPDGASGNFGFTDDIASPNSFSLADDGSKTFTNVQPGQYSVTEDDPTPGFDLTNLVCDDANSTEDIPNRTATINIEPDETVTCTFTNTQRGTVIIEKETDPDGASGSFGFTDDIEAPNSFNLSDGQSKTFMNVVPGGYSVAENDPTPAFDLTNVVCDDANSTGDVETATATINVEAGETVTCTFTNTQRGTIIIEKETDPDGASGSFGFTDDIASPNAFSLSDGQSETFNNVMPGSYSVTEDDPTPGFDLTALVCDDANSTESVATRTASIEVEAGETVTCTFTNTQRGTIIIEKETDPDGASGSFGFTDDIASPNAFSLSDGGSETFNNVVPGSYSVTEDDPTPGFDLTALVCDDANSTESVATRTASIEVEAGETVTCTFTNTQRAEVTLNKRESGALPLSIAFAFEIRVGASVTESGTVVATGTANTTTGVVNFSCSPNPNASCENDAGIAKLIPGDYAVCEVDMLPGWANNISAPPGYTPDSEIPEGSDNGVECVDVELAAGQTGSPLELPDPIDNTPPPGGDARTIGYWKNHSCMAPGNQDDVLSENLPIQLTDTWLISDCETVVFLLDKRDLSNRHTKRANDGAYNLAAQLAAALLNVNAGAGTCSAVLDAIDDAQELLASINFDGEGQYLRPKQDAALYAEANSLAAILDDYNNNELCP